MLAIGNLAHSYSSCVYCMVRFKGSNGKVCKIMMSHFRTLLRCDIFYCWRAYVCVMGGGGVGVIIWGIRPSNTGLPK